MKRISVIIADDQYLVREGLKSIISSDDGIEIAGEVSSFNELKELLLRIHPNVITIDYSQPSFRPDNIAELKEFLPSTTSFLAITPYLSRAIILKAVQSGVLSHVLKNCDRKEIIDAVYSSAKKEKFFCGKVIDVMMNEEEPAFSESGITSASCDPLILSVREIEIIRLVAEGHTARQIADKLCISNHTVNTHRKNIMNKLGVNNTAGLVMYAVRQQIIGPNRFLFENSLQNT